MLLAGKGTSEGHGQIHHMQGSYVHDGGRRTGEAAL